MTRSLLYNQGCRTGLCLSLGIAWLLVTGAAWADLSGAVATVEPSVVVVVASQKTGPDESKHTFGSGFFITSTDIVTAAHVLQGAQSIRVVTSADDRYSAAVVGVDLLSRVALLRVADPVGTPVRFAEAPDVLKGQSIFTVGSHLGMFTVAAGMVNGTERTVTTSGLPSVNDAFQIDAPIAADGAGGPVFAVDGNVVGMVLHSIVPNTGMVLRPPGEEENELGGTLMPGGLTTGDDGPDGEPSAREALTAVVTFCLPADTVAYVARQLSQTGAVRRGRLGVSMSPTPAATAAHLGIDRRASAMVVSVAQGGPAEQAGLKPYDIVIAMDGRPIRGVRHVVKSLQARPGEAVPLTVRRGREELLVQVNVGEMTVEGATHTPGQGGAPNLVTPGADRPLAWLGVDVVPLDASLAAHSGLGTDAGAAVRYVFPGSPAEAAGLAEGDVVLSISSPKLGDDQIQGPPVLRLQHRVRSLSPGDAVVVEVSRLGAAEARVQINATLGTPDGGQVLALTAPAYQGTGAAF